MSSISDVKSGTLVYAYGARPELFTVASGSYHSSISFGSGATPQVSYNGVTIPFGVSYGISATGANTLYQQGSPSVYTMNGSTSSTFIKVDDMVFFNVTIDINSTGTVPAPLPGCIGTGSEVRIRNLIPSTAVVGNNGLINDPSGTMSRSWAPPRLNSMPPTFRDVQMYFLGAGSDPTSPRWIMEPIQGNIASFAIHTGSTYEYGARLLSDDTFALYLNVFDTAFTDVDIEAQEYPITYEMLNNLILVFGSPEGYNRLVIQGSYFSC